MQQEASGSSAPYGRAAVGTSTTQLSADDLRGLLGAASAWIDRNADAVNAINVFPVPDGDTGSNMAATLRGALGGVVDGSYGAGELADAVARQALLSARGNSGVILSQWLRGFADELSSRHYVDGPALADALSKASATAYGALQRPLEGTILTVARSAAESAALAAPDGPAAVMHAAADGARVALATTPDLLPVLKNAGVVDSGGFGLVLMLEGAERFLEGRPPPVETYPVLAPRADWLRQTSALHAEKYERFGYCTEYVLTCDTREIAPLQRALERLGDAVIVVGERDAIHAHVHTDNPGAALQLGTVRGTLTLIKIDNMQAQHERFATRAAEVHAPTGGDAEPAIAIATVAVINGDGLADVARSLGLTRVVRGGQTMNPSVEQLLEAIESAPAERVIVLPNNNNIRLTAEQAAALSTKQVSLVPTKSVSQGMSALLSVNQDLSCEENVEAMTRAASVVRTIEVTTAVRGTRLGDVEIGAGQPIALLDGELAAAGESSDDALLAALVQVEPIAGAIATLYYGANVNLQQAQAAAAHLRERFETLEIELLWGGQPLYDYTLSVE